MLPIFGYDSIDDAVTAANATDFGLTASVWTGDDALADRIAGQLVAGTVSVNCHGLAAQDPAPAVRRLRPVRHRPRTRRRGDPGLHPAADFRPAPRAPLAGPRAPLAALRRVAKKADQETTSGCCLSNARRCRSVMPPQTPNSTSLSSASARHSGDDGTVPAQSGRIPLRLSANEEFVGIGGETKPLQHPRGAGVGHCADLGGVCIHVRHCSARLLCGGSPLAMTIPARSSGVSPPNSRCTG